MADSKEAILFDTVHGLIEATTVAGGADLPFKVSEQLVPAPELRDRQVMMIPVDLAREPAGTSPNGYTQRWTLSLFIMARAKIGGGGRRWRQVLNDVRLLLNQLDSTAARNALRTAGASDQRRTKMDYWTLPNDAVGGPAGGAFVLELDFLE